MTDAQMMAKIKASMGKPIRDAIAGTPFPEFFVAALVANESSGDPTVKRLEAAIFVDLARVLAGRDPHFGSIDAPTLQRILTSAGIAGNPIQAVTNRLFDLATSWGPTQIMGYDVIPWAMTVEDLQQLPAHFRANALLLKQMQEEFKLDVPTQPGDPEWEKFFRCWNTGRPDGATTDPNYCAKGMARMALYAGLP